ncbi:hypothetical protein PG987_006625 [Apiospora arundinis]
MGKEPANRRRRVHTRSRKGCIACKKRHVRCDEARPACTSCMMTSWQCVYPSDGNAMQSQPIIAPRLGAHVGKVPIDPFDSLPIKMSRRSLELWQRFTHVDPLLTRNSPVREIQYLSLSRADPSVCHLLILLAAVHSTDSLDALGDFKATFLDHKVHAIEMVNAWLTDPDLKYSSQCIRVVSTLCLIEACFGDQVAARVHNKGLLQLLEMKKNGDEHVNRDKDVLDRFVFVVQLIIRCMLDDPRCISDDENPFSHQYRSDLLRLTPYLLRAGEQLDQPKGFGKVVQAGCLGPLSAKTHGHVNVMDGIALLEDMNPVAGGGMLELIWTFARLHVFSLGDALEIGMPEHCQVHPVPGLSTTWSCLVSITFNFCKLIMQWPDDRIFPEDEIADLVEVGTRNVDMTWTAMLNGTCDRDMWFWEAFASLLVLIRVRRSFGRLSPHLQRREQALSHYIKAWSHITGTTTWEGARQVLQKVVWYYNGPEEIARETWARAMA